MPKPGNKIRTEDELLAAILKIKPTADMPRPSTFSVKPKTAKSKAKRSK